MPTVLITGANRGLGLGFARHYASLGWRVIATARDPDRARDLGALDGVEVQPLDVADIAAVRALPQRLGRPAIDLLLCNAGIGGPDGDGLITAEGRDDLEVEGWQETFLVNTISPTILATVMAPLVAASQQRRMVALSSQMGSIADNSSGGSIAYRSSKAALNASWKSLSLTLRDQGVIVAVVHPGWVQTDMGGPGATLPVADSVARLAAVIERLGPQDSGGFFSHDGRTLPW